MRKNGERGNLEDTQRGLEGKNTWESNETKKARCLQLSRKGRKKRGRRPIAPHLLLFSLSGLEHSWAFFVLHHLSSPSSPNSLVSPVPIPPKTTHPLIFHQFSNPQSPTFLPFPPRLCAFNDKSLDYTVQQQPFIPLPPIPPSLYSFIWCWLSFHHCHQTLFIQLSCPSSFLCSTSYTLSMCALARTCNSMLAFICAALFVFPYVSFFTTKFVWIAQCCNYLAD